MTTKQLNEWFNSLDFVTMERITRLRQSEFSPNDGYQDFVETCEQWWKDTQQVEKEYIYNTYN
jgi:hypothetical protein